MYGFDGIIAACLVAVKQIMPDNEITLLGFIRFRVKVRLTCQCSPAGARDTAVHSMYPHTGSFACRQGEVSS